MRATAALMLLAIHAVVSGGTIEPDTDDSRHVEHGKKFSSVARLTCWSIADKKFNTASCVIISPRWVITAAHAVHGADNWTVEADDGEIKRLSAVIVHKDFNGVVGDYDIAIGRVKGEFQLDEYPPLYTERNEAGKVVSIVGHGWTGTMDKGSTEYDGLKRGGKNVVEYTTGDFIVCRASDAGHHIDLEFMVAPGDSGGGLFIGKSLAGVNAYRRDPRSKDGSAKSVFGDESGHLRISVYGPWIKEEIEKHESK